MKSYSHLKIERCENLLIISLPLSLSFCLSLCVCVSLSLSLSLSLLLSKSLTLAHLFNLLHVSEMVGNISSKDDVMHEIQHGFVVGRTEVLKHIATSRVEDTQCLGEMVSLWEGRRGKEEEEEGGG